jgi:hypothetical protein
VADEVRHRRVGQPDRRDCDRAGHAGVGPLPARAVAASVLIRASQRAALEAERGRGEGDVASFAVLDWDR